MSKRGFVLDASALLASLFEERGAERVVEVWPLACISAVNLSEAIAKLVDRSVEESRIDRLLTHMEIEVVPFDRSLAERAGRLRADTKRLGLSFADRACLATASARGGVALTADRAWQQLSGTMEIEFIR